MSTNNYIVKTIMVISLVSQMSSCNYLGGFIGSGISGLVTYPFNRLAEAFQDGTDDYFDAHLTDEQRRHTEETLRLINYCRFVEGAEFPESFVGIAQALEQRQCLGCVPWGRVFECSVIPDTRTDSDLRILFGSKADEIMSSYSNLAGSCCSVSCSDRCSRLCPEGAAIMGQARRNSIPYRENTLPMGNSGEDYSHPENHSTRPAQIDAPTGYNGGCHGHSTVRANIAALGQFDAPAQESPPLGEDGQPLTGEDLDEFYESVLSDLARGNVRRVPGYSNLRDFTSRAGIAPVLRAEVLRSFHQQARTNPFMVESLSVKKDFDAEKYSESMEDINRNISVAGSAQVTFGFDAGGGHTVEVYKTHVETINGREVTKMCITDSNKTICNYDYSQEGAPCVSRSGDYLSATLAAPPSSQIVDGVYCPRIVTSYNDNFSYDFPGHGLNTGNSFDVDRQQNRNVNNSINKLSSYCKQSRGCE